MMTNMDNYGMDTRVTSPQTLSQKTLFSNMHFPTSFQLTRKFTRKLNTTLFFRLYIVCQSCSLPNSIVNTNIYWNLFVQYNFVYFCGIV